MFHIIKNLAKHSAIYGVADMLSRALGFLMIPLYTHYLSTSDYGTLELLDLTSYIAGMFLGMGITQAVMRFYYKYDDPEMKQHVLSVAMITLSIISVSILALLLLFSDEISTLVFDSESFSRLINIVFITFVIQLAQEVPKALLRMEEKSVLFVSISFTKTLLSLGLNVYFIVGLGLGVMGLLFSGLITASVSAIGFAIYILRRVKFTFSFKMARELLKFGVPLVWGTLGMFILNFGDRFILQRMMSLSEVGIYALAYKFGMMPNMLVMSPFLMIWGPKRFDLVKEANAKSIFATIFTYFVFIEILVSLGIAVTIKDVISVAADPSYAEAHKYVPLLLVSYILNGIYVYVQFGLHLENKTKYLALATLTAAAINTACNLLLIPVVGIWGAAVSTVVAFTFLTIYTHVKSQRLYVVNYEVGRIVKMSVVAMILYAVSLVIDVPNLAFSLIVKMAIALSFPIILYFWRFYSEDELRKMTELSRLVVGTSKRLLLRNSRH